MRVTVHGGFLLVHGSYLPIEQGFLVWGSHAKVLKKETERSSLGWRLKMLEHLKVNFILWGGLATQ